MADCSYPPSKPANAHSVHEVVQAARRLQNKVSQHVATEGGLAREGGLASVDNILAREEGGQPVGRYRQEEGGDREEAEHGASWGRSWCRGSVCPPEAQSLLAATARPPAFIAAGAALIQLGGGAQWS